MAREDGMGRVEPAPERQQTPTAVPQAVAGGYTIGIRRTGELVEITLASGTEYAAMELYDSLVQSVERGFLRLELKLPRS